MPLSQILIDGEGWKKVDKPGAKPKRPAFELKGPDGRGSLDEYAPGTYSLDRGTQFLAVRNYGFVVAVPARADGSVVGKAANYAPLRTRRGEKTIDVTGLATDRDGRIYAATDIGVQVFDPTGRLCGVLTPAATGAPEAMAFEGDTLTLWVGNDKYARKLNTTGAK